MGGQRNPGKRARGGAPGRRGRDGDSELARQGRRVAEPSRRQAADQNVVTGGCAAGTKAGEVGCNQARCGWITRGEVMAQLGNPDVEGMGELVGKRR